MSDEKPGQKSNIIKIIISIGVFLGAVAAVTTPLANIVKDGSTIWEKLLPITKVPGITEPSVSSQPGTTPSDSSSDGFNPGTLENQSVTGTIEVKADSPQGTLFINRRSSTEKYDFFAKGQWSYNKQLELLNGPGGHPRYTEASKSYKLPKYPEGALIIRKQDGSYQWIGTQAELTLKPGEKVFFTINDATDGASDSDSYSDNGGTLRVEWSCGTCQ